MWNSSPAPRVGSLCHTDPRGRLAIPPVPILIAILALLLGLVVINWPGLNGPTSDRHLNAAIYAAAHHSYAPEALAAVTSLDLHRYRIHSFQGLEKCPNLESLTIHPDSVPYWQRYVDAQVPETNVLTPDVRPTLPLLPHLKEVKVGAP